MLRFLLFNLNSIAHHLTLSVFIRITATHQLKGM